MKTITHIPWYMYFILWAVKSDITIDTSDEGIYTITSKEFLGTRYIVDSEFQEYKSF